MNNEVVLDIETQNTFQEVGSYDHSKLKISVVGVYFYETDEYLCYEEHELPKLWTRLEKSGRIIGYNTKGFDYPVMNNYYAGDFMTFPSLDILEEINKALGFRLKLDDVAAASVGHRKTGHGLQAVEWWKQGEIQKIKDYCLGDVKVTKEVYEFALKNGFILYDDKRGERHAVEINVAPQQAATAVNFTLGF